MPGYTVVLDPVRHQPVPEQGILTRPIFEDDSLRVVLFTFSAGQCLSEHTASSPALLQFYSGEATITLGPERFDVSPGAWVRMDAGLAHSIVAKSTLVMLLALLKKAPSRQA